MDYTGHVDPGGATATRTVDTPSGQAEIRKLSVGPMDNNAYVIRDAASSQALLVDAANDGDRLLSELDALDVIAILTTHGHPDHWQALEQVRHATRAPVLLHPADAAMVTWTADEPAADGQTLSVGSLRIRLLHTPGHTAGSTCALLGDHLFTGDTLFPGGPGNTFGNADAFTQIMRSVRERLFVLGDETWVYPGHGDDTTLGTERPHLPAWRARGW